MVEDFTLKHSITDTRYLSNSLQLVSDKDFSDDEKDNISSQMKLKISKLYSHSVYNPISPNSQSRASKKRKRQFSFFIRNSHKAACSNKLIEKPSYKKTSSCF